jgi:hypothetical protein
MTQLTGDWVIWSSGQVHWTFDMGRLTFDIEDLKDFVMLVTKHPVGAVYDRAFSWNQRNTRGHRPRLQVEQPGTAND